MQVLDLFGAPNSYFDAIALSPWQTANGDRAVYALQVASAGAGVLSEFHGEWEERELTAVIARPTASSGEQWGVNEMKLERGGTILPLEAEWNLITRPNPWDAVFAFDRNLMSRWGTWSAASPEVFVGVDFGAPVRVSGARLVCQAHEQRGQVQFHGRLASGQWEVLNSQGAAATVASRSLRRSAVRVVQGAGFRYVLGVVGESGYGPLMRALATQPEDWGIEVVERLGNFLLIRLDGRWEGVQSRGSPSKT
jgi:hypothetical protein